MSEKIALGQQVKKKEATYDQRLFNQSQGMDSGFRGEEGASPGSALSVLCIEFEFGGLSPPPHPPVSNSTLSGDRAGWDKAWCVIFQVFSRVLE